jgi:NitT/TauT family transport system substrate-binding protein
MHRDGTFRKSRLASQPATRDRRRPGNGPLPRRQLSRRAFLRLAAGGTAGLIGSGLLGGALTRCRPQKGAAAAPVKIGYIPILDSTALLIAHAKGFYADEGLVAERPTLIRSWAQISEAFMAGIFNLIHLLPPIPIYMRYGLGFPVKVVAWASLNNSAFVVREGSGIESTAGLGGKQVAVPGWYSCHNILLQAVLRHHGLEPVIQDRSALLAAHQTNVFVVNPPDMPTALANGDIDAYVVAAPFDAVGEVEIGAHIIRFTGDIWRNHPCSVAVMNERLIADNPDWAQKVVRAIVKAERWCVDNTAEAARILSKDGEGYLPFPADIVQRAATKYDLATYGPSGTGAIQHPEWGVKRLGFQPYPFPSALVTTVDLLRQAKLGEEASFLHDLDPAQAAAELTDDSLVKEALAEAGGVEGFDGVDPAQPYERAEVVAP